MADALQRKLSELAEELGVPGAAAAVIVDGVEHYGFHGVTSVDNPLAVDETTQFQFGSTGKTYTATAMMRLVEQGKVDLAAPVRTYVPELKLRDDDVARNVTVEQLFNHTAGWEGDFIEDTGDGDDALERYVGLMADLQQVSPLGATVSYNNASLCLAGRLIEKVTGTTFEEAMQDLVLSPLGLDNTFFFAKNIMTKRFSVGHAKGDDGEITVQQRWALPRSGNPAGGMTANAADQLAWARFHLGDGAAPDGTRFLSAETLRRMQSPSADMHGSALGDQVGISWLLRDVEGVRLVSHGGTMIGQYSAFVMVPERHFAVISMSNCGPNGPELNQRIVRWALEHHLGLVEPEAEQLLLDDDALAAYTGNYETIAAVCEVTSDAGRLSVKVRMKPEAAETMRAKGEEVPDQPPITIAMVSGDGDHYVVAEGAGAGMKGYFSRGTDGAVDAVSFGGRLATRVRDAAAVT